MSRDKTKSCLWCGNSEAYGAVLKEKPNAFGTRMRYVCVDTEKCDAHIKRSMIIGAPR